MIWPKLHTIRAGNRFKEGDRFSPCVWSGLPYRSKIIKIAPDIQIKKIFYIEVSEEGDIFINRKIIATRQLGLEEINTLPLFSKELKLLAKNDGLYREDFRQWIVRPNIATGKTWTGQIICWSDDVKYP